MDIGKVQMLPQPFPLNQSAEPRNFPHWIGKVFVNTDWCLHWVNNPRAPKHKGGRVGTLEKDGYVKFKCGPRYYMEHRVIWEIFHGPIPDGMQVDHIDGNRSNNNINNLRLATVAHNGQNRKLSPLSTTGIKGVTVANLKRKKYWKGTVTAYGTVHSKVFGYTEAGKQLAIRWVETTRAAFHKQFANHGERNELPQL